MRIERKIIRLGQREAILSHHQEFASRKKKIIAKLRKKNATTENAKRTIFLPLDVDHDYFELPDFYHCNINPLVQYVRGNFIFSEMQLKKSIQDKALPIGDLTMHVHDTEKGKTCLFFKIDRELHCIERIIKIINLRKRIELYTQTLNCTECGISFKGVEMRIYRFYQPGCHSGRFILYPTMQLCDYPLEMDEIAFYQLDLIALLFDMAEEIRERQDILIDYCKQVTVRKLNANTTEIQDIKFWDEKRVAQAAFNYSQNGMNYQDALTLLKRNLMKPLKDYFNKCILSYPETIKKESCFFERNSRRAIRIFHEYRNFTQVWVFETIYDGASYSFILDNKQYSQHALDQYLTKVDEYGALWNKLARLFQSVFYKRSTNI